MDDPSILFECPRCFQQYNSDDRKPKYLSCHDTVCLACAKRLVQRGKITCPKCSVETTVSSFDVDVFLRTDNEKLLFLDRRSGDTASRLISWCWTCTSKANDVCFSLHHETSQMSEVQQKPTEVLCQKNWNEAKAIRTTLQSVIIQFKESLQHLLYQLDGIEDDNNRKISNVLIKLNKHSGKTSPHDVSAALATKNSTSDLSEAQQLLSSFQHSEELPMGIFLGQGSDRMFQISASTKFINPLDGSGETFSWLDARNILSCILGFIQHEEKTVEKPAKPEVKPKPRGLSPVVLEQEPATTFNQNPYNDSVFTNQSVSGENLFEDGGTYENEDFVPLRHGGLGAPGHRIEAVNNAVGKPTNPTSPSPPNFPPPVPAQRLVHQGTRTFDHGTVTLVKKVLSLPANPPPIPRRFQTELSNDSNYNNNALEEHFSLISRTRNDEETATASSSSTNLSTMSSHYSAAEGLEEIYVDVATPVVSNIAATKNCAWHPSCDWVVSSTEGSNAIVTFCTENPSQKAKWARLEHFDDPVKQMVWSPDGSMLVTGSQNGCIRLWKVTQSDDVIKAYCSLKQHMKEILVLKFNSKGNYLLSGGTDRKLYAWNLKNNANTLQQEWDYHKDSIVDIDWKDDMTFATVSADGNVYLGKIGTKLPLKTFPGSWTRCVRWDASKEYLALGSTDSEIKVWSFSNNEFTSFKGHKNPVTDLSWSWIASKEDSETKPNYLTSCSKDKTIRIWDFQKGKEKYSLSSKDKTEVNCVAVSPNGKFLATGSHGGQVELWKIKKGARIFHEGLRESICQIMWNYSGDKLAVSTTGYGVKIFSVVKYVKGLRSVSLPGK